MPAPDVKQQTPNPDATKGAGGTGFVPPADGSWVPRERLNEATAEVRTLSERLARLEGRLSALPSGGQPPVAPRPELKKTYTRQELNAAVARGGLTREQADDVWAVQLESNIATKVDQTTAQAVAAVVRAQRLDSELGQYRTLVPDAFVDNGNAQRGRVRQEWEYLTSLGHPDSPETELAALRAAFGPAAALSTARQKPDTRETHQETFASGDGGDSGADTPDPGKPPKGLTRDEYAYYDDLRRKGIYRDWNAVREELKFANQGLRKRMGARFGVTV